MENQNDIISNGINVHAVDLYDFAFDNIDEEILADEIRDLNIVPEELKSLKCALSFYKLTSDELIKTFICTQKQQNLPSQNQLVGEINVQVDFFNHEYTGEQKVTVKIIEAYNLRGASQPFVEVHLVGPNLADKKRKMATRSQSNKCTLKFNETMHFFIGNEGKSEYSELMFLVKNYCFAREDPIVGVAVLPLVQVLEQGSSFAGRVQLGCRLYIDEIGIMLLRILSKHENDVAKEFVRLKMECRISV